MSQALLAVPVMPDDDPSVLLHVGYHKTATTWLQHVYFPAHPGIHAPFERPELSRIVVRPHGFTFDAKVARGRLMEGIHGAGAGQVVALSNERFSGNPASGGVDALEMVDRLAETLPEATVWLSLREQAGIITSYYNQFIKQGGTATLKQFLAGNKPNKRIPLFTTEYFEYLPLVKHFEERFGKDRVLVTLFEEFRDDRDAVLGDVGALAGFDHDPAVVAGEGARNVSYSDRSIRSLRWLNGLFVHPLFHQHFRPMIRLPGHRVVRGVLKVSDRMFGAGRKTIKPKVKQILGDRYAASNRALGEHLGKDLARWGYVTEDQ